MGKQISTSTDLCAPPPGEVGDDGPLRSSLAEAADWRAILAVRHRIVNAGEDPAEQAISHRFYPCRAFSEPNEDTLNGMRSKPSGSHENLLESQ